ncbi:hypothetical protein MBAV_005959 [Candidatus Magnetobacterium bavaricum]|uniref:Uncharacterized protein n=1 Tax=Candidatus Magnetobacterium bavaricum TaxID=29290 RepID=A0A0F3GJ54_9BACT|nr:hypothetical protein MBAV_005959 [Candidatus Magnetobacterium bavaricum]
MYNITIRKEKRAKEEEQGGLWPLDPIKVLRNAYHRMRDFTSDFFSLGHRFV